MESDQINIFQYQQRSCQIRQMLKIQDLNSIIKYFTTEIYKRLMELEGHSQSSANTSQSETLQKDDQQNLIENIISKYSGYVLSGEIEVQYTRKMTQRVLQIFGFYKWKCRNQSILNHAERQLTNKLNLLLAESTINISKIMNYIIYISKRGFIHKNLPPPPCTTFTKYGQTPDKSRRKLNSKSETREAKQVKETNTLETPCFSEYFSTKKRRTASVMCYNSSNNVHPVAQMLQKLYSGMNIDKTYMSKVIESENYLTRDQLKRNKSTLRKVQQIETIQKQKSTQSSSTRKVRTQSREPCQFQQKNVLREVKTNTKLGKEVIWNQEQYCEIKAPSIMNVNMLNKKRCRLKTSCWRRNKDRKSFNNQNII